MFIREKKVMYVNCRCVILNLRMDTVITHSPSIYVCISVDIHEYFVFSSPKTCQMPEAIHITDVSNPYIGICL
jgi:hypothetical protein